MNEEEIEEIEEVEGVGVRMEIRSMEHRDWQHLEQFQQKDWSDIKPYFQYYLSSSSCYPIVVEYKGELLGIGSGIQLGSMGWIAHIVVAENYRRNGLGRMLVSAIMQQLQERGCRTISLVATQDGEGLYRQLGFATFSSYLFYHSEHIIPFQNDLNMRKLQEQDMPEIIQIDYQVTGEDRSSLINHAVQQGWVVVDQDSQRMKGYYLSKLFEGPIVALDEATGCQLLEKKHSIVRSSVLPYENVKGQEFLQKLGLSHKKTLLRMSYGEKHTWSPASIFSRSSGSFG